MPSPQSPELLELFATYAGGPGSIGSMLTDGSAARLAADPLVVATGADFALFPGGGAPPTVEAFRLSTRGFKELAAVSHLGPALATLVQLRTGYGDDSWRAAAERLLASLARSRAANSVELWRDTIAVEAYRGREQAIADMIDHAFVLTSRYLSTALADESYLTADTLRDDYLEGGLADGGVPMNQMMIATFFLTGMDIAYRAIRWFRSHSIDWSRAMVIIAGQQGRPTAGVTWNTSSVATLIRGASGFALPLDRLYLAPHAPTFATPAQGDLSEVAALERPLRRIWSNTRATVELGDTMFAGYPRYSAAGLAIPDLSDPSVTEISEMPDVQGPDDWRALVTRMRMVLEDPRQLLSGCVTDYAVAQLVAGDNEPAKITVPGLDGVDYLRLAP